ncbi:MAG: hypothetical protein KDD62_01695 [Bdellovibrionales bacterium]|nr:hypothetical protein [Bdellovibrionales bacterium]
MEAQRRKYLLDRYVSFVGRTFDRYVETLIYGFVVWIQVFLLISDVQSSVTTNTDSIHMPRSKHAAIANVSHTETTGTIKIHRIKS